MTGFLLRLETREGSPAEPPTFSGAVPNWAIGDCIYLGRRTNGWSTGGTTTRSSRRSESLTT